MKKRKKYFLADNEISHESEVFDYIRELHDYLWRFVRVHSPSEGGELTKVLDKAIEKAERLR